MERSDIRDLFAATKRRPGCRCAHPGYNPTNSHGADGRRPDRRDQRAEGVLRAPAARAHAAVPEPDFALRLAWRRSADGAQRHPGPFCRNEALTRMSLRSIRATIQLAHRTSGPTL